MLHKGKTMGVILKHIPIIFFTFKIRSWCHSL